MLETSFRSALSVLPTSACVVGFSIIGVVTVEIVRRYLGSHSECVTYDTGCCFVGIMAQLILQGFTVRRPGRCRHRRWNALHYSDHSDDNECAERK